MDISGEKSQRICKAEMNTVSKISTIGQSKLRIYKIFPQSSVIVIYYSFYKRKDRIRNSDLT